MDNDTICAVATPAGGALAIIRVSGNRAIEIVSEEFSKNLLLAKGNTLHYGTIGRKEAIDDVLVSVFRTPHSYTGEDSVEISCLAQSISSSRYSTC